MSSHRNDVGRRRQHVYKKRKEKQEAIRQSGEEQVCNFRAICDSLTSLFFFSLKKILFLGFPAAALSFNMSVTRTRTNYSSFPFVLNGKQEISKSFKLFSPAIGPMAPYLFMKENSNQFNCWCSYVSFLQNKFIYPNSISEVIWLWCSCEYNNQSNQRWAQAWTENKLHLIAKIFHNAGHGRCAMDQDQSETSLRIIHSKSSQNVSTGSFTQSDNVRNRQSVQYFDLLKFEFDHFLINFECYHLFKNITNPWPMVLISGNWKLKWNNWQR